MSSELSNLFQKVDIEEDEDDTNDDDDEDDTNSIFDDEDDDEDGYTAWIYANYDGKKEIAEYLEEQGADTTVKFMG